MLSSLAAVGFSSLAVGAAERSKTKLGLCTDSSRAWARLRQEGGKSGAFPDPLTYLEYCHSLGAGGIQAPLGRRDETYCATLRRKAEEYGMFIESAGTLPRDKADLDRFEADVRTAKAMGVGAMRVVLVGGRRYENYDSLDQFRQQIERAVLSVQLAEPVAARHRIRLAIENHKDQRVGERIEMLKRLSSEFVGMCLDTNNSIALLEDPMEVVEAFAPWAWSVHLKDAAVKDAEDGFLLIDLPLGEGFLDLARMVETVRKARPEAQFTLELIARDPLDVPCLTEKYWGPMGDVPGRDLARTLRMVRAHAHQKPLPRVGQMGPEELARLEEDYVKRSLAFAREDLGL